MQAYIIEKKLSDGSKVHDVVVKDGNESIVFDCFESMDEAEDFMVMLAERAKVDIDLVNIVRVHG